jgi:hypothetical protein
MGTEGSWHQMASRHFAVRVVVPFRDSANDDVRSHGRRSRLGGTLRAAPEEENKDARESTLGRAG